MRAPASFVRHLATIDLPIATLILLASAFGCSGRRIQLGDGPLDASVSLVPTGPTAQIETGTPASFSSPAEPSEPSASLSVAPVASTSATPACMDDNVRGEEVLWIGDSWIVTPGAQHEHVRELAQASGALATNDDYVVLAAPAANFSSVAAQYSMRQSGNTKVKVLIMDGGTWDTLVAKGDLATVTRVGTAFQQFLSKVATDGTVQHIIYYLMPELPSIPGVSALRPLLQDACMLSAVPCHFIDLQPIWQTHPEYTDTSGIQASKEGGTAIAKAIWQAMQQHCIAQ
jgi:hypothetical protein